MNFDTDSDLTASAPGSRKLAVVSAGLGTPSSTRLLADRLTDATSQRLARDDVDVDVTLIDLREHAQDIVAALISGFPSVRLEEMIEALSSADGAIMVTPTFNASYSGLFKSFIDVLDPRSLVGLPIVIGATGGTERHSLVLDYAMRPLFTHLRAVVAPTGVYAATSDWGNSGDANSSGLPERIGRAGSELGVLMRDSTRADQVIDPFALAASFSPVGSSAA